MKDGNLISLDMILIDEKENLMHASVRKHLVSRFEDRDGRTYLSSDSVCKASIKNDDDDILDPSKFLNKLKFSGIPNHDIRFKEGLPIMLLRNLNQSEGICNGTRLIVTCLGKWSIRADIISGTNISKNVTIPRIIMAPNESRLPFKLNRRQLPVSPCFAMTINKSQGQTLKHVGLYLPNQAFTHGQVYVALSRASSREGLVVVNADQEMKEHTLIKNIVYREVFSNIIGK
nr:PREDICTED: ATP-dependent DNA helicase PIF1-like [Daucus carota subsp. sativus]